LNLTKQPACELDAKHVARVVELSVEAVGKPNGAKLLGAEAPLAECIDAVGVLVDRLLEELA
jgi:hypothetical protein